MHGLAVVIIDEWFIWDCALEPNMEVCLKDISTLLNEYPKLHFQDFVIEFQLDNPYGSYTEYSTYHTAFTTCQCSCT